MTVRRHLSVLFASLLLATAAFAACSGSAKMIPSRLATTTASGIREFTTASGRYQSACDGKSTSGVHCSIWIKVGSGGRHPLSANNPIEPKDIRAAYALPPTPFVGIPTVAIVDAYGDPEAESDLRAFRTQYNLGECGTTTNQCLTIINQRGQTSLPLPPPGISAKWALETAIDLEMVSATCPACHIVLVQADDDQPSDLAQAAGTAATFHPNSISNSYGWEITQTFETVYGQTNIAVVAGAGDGSFNCVEGAGVSCGVLYPASSPGVIAVGGTTLTPDSSVRGYSEAVWPMTASGCSQLPLPKPTWQHDGGCPGKRTVADVSAVAENVSVYNTHPIPIFDPNQTPGPMPSGRVQVNPLDPTPIGFQTPGWAIATGTSISTPIIAAVYALAGNRTITAAQSLYANPTALFDIISGSNASSPNSCPTAYICNAVAGYDAPSGLGSPNGLLAFGGPASTPTPTPLPPTNGPAFVSDLSVAPDGTVWLIGGTSATDTKIYKATPAGTGLFNVQSVAGAASLVAVDSTGAPWVVNAGNAIYRFSAGSFTNIPGGATAIATGPSSSAYIIGTDHNGPNDFTVYQFTGSSFTLMPGAATQIAVDVTGLPWVLTSGGAIYQYTSTTSATQINGAASQIAIGVNGGIWVLGVDNPGGDHSIYQFTAAGFTNVPGAAKKIAVDSSGAAWVVNSAGTVYQYNSLTASFQQVTAL
jgi:hypothetical protein